MASRGWKPTDVIVVFGWVYLGGLFHHGKTRKNDVLTVALFALAGRGRARLVASRSTLGGRGSCRAAGGNQRVLLWCLGGLISPRKDTENTEKRRGEGCDFLRVPAL